MLTFIKLTVIIRFQYFTINYLHLYIPSQLKLRTNYHGKTFQDPTHSRIYFNEQWKDIFHKRDVQRNRSKPSDPSCIHQKQSRLL